MTVRRKPGRPHKGPRKRIEVKLPIPLAEAVERRAQDEGQDVTALVTRLLADYLNFSMTIQESMNLTHAA